jgi:hypothetical protein
MRSRESAIDCEHDGTCTWLLDTPEYTSWRADECSEPRQRLLWIKGKAGAGKSTMVKFAVKESRRTSRNELVLPHFFNARGTTLEHSTEGMYRTLLYWSLKQLPKESLEELETIYQHHDENRAWQVPDLVDMLEAAVEGLHGRSITFYIDALDECPQNEIRDMLNIFRRIVRKALSSGRQVRVCFASRPYPHIGFTDATVIDFSDQADHLKDLRGFITDELQTSTDPSSIDISREVLYRAEGSFMWAKLVVRLLNTDVDGGHKDRLARRLYDVPSGLSELYAHILERYPEDHEALLACCQWLIFQKVVHESAYRDAPDSSVQRLWWASRQKIDKDEERTRKLYETISIADMERYILEISKGLIEIRQDRSGCRRPQFLHESAREFVLNKNRLWQLCGAQDSTAFSALGHEVLRDGSLAILESYQPTLRTLVDIHGFQLPSEVMYDMPAKSHKGKMEHPLRSYAANCIMHHAEKASTLGLNQTVFLNNFHERCGPYFLKPRLWPEHLGERDIPARVFRSVINYLVSSKADSIIRETQLPLADRAWSQGRPFGLTDDNGEISCFWILPEGEETYRSTFKALLSIYLRLRPRTARLQSVLECLATIWSTRPPNMYGPKCLSYFPEGTDPPTTIRSADVARIGELPIACIRSGWCSRASHRLC